MESIALIVRMVSLSIQTQKNESGLKKRLQSFCIPAEEELFHGWDGKGLNVVLT